MSNYGVAAGDLAQATFAHWGGKIFDNDGGARKLPWLPPAGRENGDRCFGQQFCPLCLSSDPIPYLRRIWRLAFVTTCPVHGRLLHDRCQNCGEPFNVLRQDSRDQITCWSCGHDLSLFDCDAPPVDVLPHQERLLELALLGWRTMGEYGPVYSVIAFKILAILSGLLASGRHAHALRGWIAAREDGLAIPPESVPKTREGGLLTSRARSVLVPMAQWLMEAWPERFVAAASGIGMTSRDLLKKPGGMYPFAYAHVIEWHLTVPTGSTSSYMAEVAAAKEVIHRRGERATYRNLAKLLGGKPGALRQVAERAGDGAAWGRGRYWKLDGVSPEVKAAAREAAHRAGEGVGPWLDRLLRKELKLPVQKIPLKRQSPDTFPADGISGCEV